MVNKEQSFNVLDIPETDWINIQKVFKKFTEIEKVWLYGSRAKGNARPYSDIDVALEGEDLSLELINKLSFDLDDLFLPYLFDISILRKIENEDLLAHIQRVGKLIYTTHVQS